MDCNEETYVQKLRKSRIEITATEVIDKVPKQRRKRGKNGLKNSPVNSFHGKTQHDGLKLPTKKGNEEKHGTILTQDIISEHNATEYSGDSVRLKTFQTFPKPTLRDRIFDSGYYHTGVSDETKCHRCGATVIHWEEKDDPGEFHESFCEYFFKNKDMKKAESSGNTGNQLSLLDIPLTEANSPMTSLSPPMTPSITEVHALPKSEDTTSEDEKHKESGMELQTPELKIPAIEIQSPQGLSIPRVQEITKVRNIKQNARHHSSPVSLEYVHFEDHKEFLKKLNLCSEEDRRKTFLDKDKWKNNTDNIVDVDKLAKSGFFYLGNHDRTQCYSCGKVFKGWQRRDKVHLVHKTNVPYCEMVTEDEDKIARLSTTSLPLHPSITNHAQFGPSFEQIQLPAAISQPSGTSGQELPAEAMEFQSHPVQVTTEEPENSAESNIAQAQNLPLDLCINRSHSLTNQRGLPISEGSENVLSWPGSVSTRGAQETVPTQTSLTTQHPVSSTPFVVARVPEFRGVQPQSEGSSSGEETEERRPAQIIQQNPSFLEPQIPGLPLHGNLFNAGASGMSASLSLPQYSVSPITSSVSSTEQNRQSEWELLFPCEHPAMPLLRSALTRQETFDYNWPSGRMEASVDDFARAGFFYVGQAEYVKCWYCGGQINNWSSQDDPWKEHARLFPTCEFLLQQKGPEFIHQISIQNPPPLSRYPQSHSPYRRASTSSSEISSGEMSPILSIPGSPSRVTILGRPYYSHSERSHPSPPPAVIDPRVEEARQKEILQRALNSEDVMRVVEMGFDINQIRRIIKHKVRNSGSAFATTQQLVDALINTANMSSSSSSESEMETETTMPLVSGPSTSNVEPGTTTQPATSGASTAVSLAPASAASTQSTQSTSMTSGTATQSSQSTSGALDPKKLDEKLREYEIEKRCKVCLDKDAAVVFVPCGHLCTCMTCARALRNCPLCRKKIKKSMRTYTS